MKMDPLLSSSKCWDSSQVPSCVLLMQPCRLKFITIKPHLLSKPLQLFLQVIHLHWFRKPKFRGPYLKPLHPNAFTWTLPLSEGREGGAWETSKRRCSFSLPAINSLLLLPWLLTFTCSSTILSPSFLYAPTFRLLTFSSTYLYQKGARELAENLQSQ
jgi:hypothetical protein